MKIAAVEVPAVNGRSMGLANRSATGKTVRGLTDGTSARRAVGVRALRPAVHGGDFYGGDNLDAARSLKVRRS